MLSGQHDYVGIPWIKPETLVVRQTGRMVITLEDTGPDDVQLVREQLAAVNLKISKIALE